MPVLGNKSMLPSERFLGCGVKGEISIMLLYADGVTEYHQQQAQCVVAASAAVLTGQGKACSMAPVLTGALQQSVLKEDRS